MEINNFQYFQGDIPIIKLDKLDVEVEFQKLPQGGVIVAEGEISGHFHKIVAEKTSEVEIAQIGNEFYMRINKGEATIQHQEHKPITFGIGVYYVGKQYEYDELAERQVRD